MSILILMILRVWACFLDFIMTLIMMRCLIMANY